MMQHSPVLEFLFHPTMARQATGVPVLERGKPAGHWQKYVAFAHRFRAHCTLIWEFRTTDG
jgi:hypothetical protein